MNVDISSQDGNPSRTINEQTALLTSSPSESHYATTVSSPPKVTASNRINQDEERYVDGENGVGTLERSTNTNEKSAAGIISVLLIGVLIANADGSLVLSSYGRIASEFDDLENASWLVTSYVLAMSAAQPLYGKLSGIYGRTYMILVAYTFFAIGCAVSALGWSLSSVVAGRVISGFGGAGMDSLVSIIITDLVPPRNVGSWRAYVNIIATTGRALGGPVGGYLADSVGWRWSFLGQCPLTIIAILSTWLMIPNQSIRLEEGNTTNKLSRIDFLGSFLLASTILLFLLPLELAGDKIPWTHPLILGLFVAAVITCVLFIAVEESWAKEPLFNIRFLRSRSVVVPNLVMFFQTAAQLGMMYTVPIYFQITQNASSTVAGAHLFPAVVGVATAGLFGGHFIKRTGRYKHLLIFATLCSSSSYLLLFLLWHGHTNWLESLYIVPGGVGNGLVQSGAFVALTAGIDAAQIEMACSTFFMSANTGSVVGIATTSAVLQGTLRKRLETGLRRYPKKLSIIEKSMSNINYVHSLEGDVKDIVVGVYTRSLGYSHLVNFSCAVIALIASFFLEEVKI